MQVDGDGRILLQKIGNGRRDMQEAEGHRCCQPDRALGRTCFIMCRFFRRNSFSQDSRGAFRETKPRLGKRKSTGCAVEQCCADAAFKTGYRLRHRGLGKTKRLGRGGEGTMLDDSGKHGPGRSEEHTSELQSLMRISYAVFCLKKK